MLSPEQELFWPQVTFFDDGLATIHDSSFLKDARFQKAYASGAQTGSWRGTNNQWRVHTQCWAAETASRLQGDFVECGVYRGGSARAIIEFANLDTARKTYYLLDSFEGMDPALMSETERANSRVKDAYEPTFEFVRKLFAERPYVKIVRGNVPETLPQVKSERVAFLHLDMNCAGPEVAAAEYFWDRLVPGALVLLDDYAYRGYTPQKEAFDAFAKKRGISILTMPTGQGLIQR